MAWYEKKEMELNKLAFRFKIIVENNQSLDLWSKDDFLKYLDNKEEILKRVHFETDGIKVFGPLNSPPPNIDFYKEKFESIENIYKIRYPEQEEPEKGYTKKEILFIAEKLKIFELDIFKEMKVETRNKILGKIFDCSHETIKKYYNFIPNAKRSTSDYYPTQEQQTEILKKYPDLDK